MKNRIKKISVSLMLAACELLLGLLLLINPTGLTSVVIIALGILLMALGAFHLFQYIRLPQEEAAKTWKLASGAGVLAIGVAFIANQHWMVQILGTLMTLYGGIALAAAFMKMQIAVDALRFKRPFWHLMAISFLVTIILAVLLFINLFAESAVWTVTGIVLLGLALLDTVYFILGRTKKKA